MPLRLAASLLLDRLAPHAVLPQRTRGFVVLGTGERLVTVMLWVWREGRSGRQGEGLCGGRGEGVSGVVGVDEGLDELEVGFGLPGGLGERIALPLDLVLVVACVKR
jgi:hypothetical protein